MKKVFILFSIFVLMFSFIYLAFPVKSEAYFGISLNFGSDNGYGYGNYSGGDWRSNYYANSSYGYYGNSYNSYGSYGYGGGFPTNSYSYGNRYPTNYNSYSRYNYTPGYREMCTYRCY